jgi:hypothetical protein
MPLGKNPLNEFENSDQSGDDVARPPNKQPITKRNRDSFI